MFLLSLLPLYPPVIILDVNALHVESMSADTIVHARGMLYSEREG